MRLFYAKNGLATNKAQGKKMPRMKKFAVAMIMVMLSHSIWADGVFTVTQYNMKTCIETLNEIEYAISRPASYVEMQATKAYSQLAFASGDVQTQGAPHFYGSMVHIPINRGSSGCFAVEVVGSITIQEPGYWTFAFGSDDGFRAEISGQGILEKLSSVDLRTFETTLHKVLFEKSGKYNIRLLWFTRGYANAPEDLAGLEVSIAQGAYSSFNPSAFKLLRASADSVSYEVWFNDNGGKGRMEPQEFENSKEQKLAKNTYTKDGYVFQGWAESKVDADNGFVKYRDEALITVDHGMTLYAVWANPALMLIADSTDWADGTITLRCDDADDSGAEHEYCLSYYENIEQEKKWYDIEGATRIKASREVDSNGNSTCGVCLTDARFAKRNMGLGTVRYRITDENGRTAECETRNRHGLFVAIDAYQNEWLSLKGHLNHKEEADAFRRAYMRYGGANGYLPMTLNGSLANRNDILDELTYIAESKVAPGDIFLFYYVGHGANGWLTCYHRNTYISASELSSRLHKFPVGVGVVALIDSCHSSGMIDTTGIDDGMGNIAWIVAAQADQTTYCGAFRAVLYDRGWVNGAADYYDPTGVAGGNGDGYVTFSELAFWGQQWTGKTYYQYRTLTDYWNSLVLRNIVAGVVPNHKSVTPLTAGPSTLTAISGNAGEIRLSWTPVSGASGYDIYRKLRSAKPNTYVYVDTVKGTSTRDGSSYALTPNVEYEYHVRAVNDVYVSDASPTASCAPSENMEIRAYASRVMSALSTSSIHYSEHPPMVDGEVNYSNLNYDHDGDGMTTFEEYVAGTNPADNADRFVASIKIEEGRPLVSWSPNLNTNGSERIYTILGKINLTDGVGWMSPTNSGHRFFKVLVEMP